MLAIKDNLMVAVGYAPTTPAMSMQYSTIELTALTFKKLLSCLDLLRCFNFLRLLPQFV